MTKRRREEEGGSGAAAAAGGQEDDASSMSEEEVMEEMRAAGMLGGGAAGGPGGKPVRPQVNNVAGLRQALEGIRQDLPWVERLEVVSAEHLDVVDSRDDLKMELAL